MKHTSSIIALLLAGSAALVSCSGGSEPTPEPPANRFTMEGNLYNDVDVVIPEAVPLTFNNSLETNRVFLKGVATDGDSVFFELSFPGRTTGRFVWSGTKGAPSYAKLYVAQSKGVRFEMMPDRTVPVGETVVDSYDSTSVSGTFSGELKGPGYNVRIVNGAFRAER